MYRIFLTDGTMRRTLAATRALAAAGHHVTIGEETRFNPTFYSRGCHKGVLYPSPRRDPHAFINFLVDYLRGNPHDMFFPMESDTLDLVLAHRDSFEAVTHLPFVNMERYLTFRDKRNAAYLVDRVGIPAPRTVCPASVETVIDECVVLRYPLIIKPRHGWGSRGITSVETPEELFRAYRTLDAEDALPIVQEKIPQGKKFYVGAIFGNDHRPIAFTVHEELRNYPLDRGPSTAQRSVNRPDLIDYTARVLSAANWVGVANADFMIDPRDGTPYFMEINPRFWGPLQASIQAGVNFPDLLARVAMGESIPPQAAHKVGEVTRAFLPYEMMNFVANPDRLRMEPNFFEFFGANVGYDILAWQDPAPTVGFFLTVLRYLNDPEVWIRQARMEKLGRWLAKRQGKAIADVAAVSEQRV